MKNIVIKINKAFNNIKLKFEKNRKKYYSVLFFAISIFGYFAANCYLLFLEHVANRDFSSVLYWVQWPIIVLISLIFLIIFIPAIREFFSGHSACVNNILVLMTILITFSVYFVFNLNQFYLSNTQLVASNKINSSIASSILTNPGYEQEFYVDVYEQGLSFISKNFLDTKCVDGYYGLLLEMRAFNYRLTSRDEIRLQDVKKIMDSSDLLTENCHPASTDSW